MPAQASPQPSLPALQSETRLLGLLRLQGPVAQSGERRPRMAEVRGSSPLGSTLFFCCFAGKTQGQEMGFRTTRGCCAATVQQHPRDRGPNSPIAFSDQGSVVGTSVGVLPQ